jgi:cytochrome b subunit of formate dehydrogenase
LRIDLILCICFADYPLVFCSWYSAHQALQVQVLEENAICFACYAHIYCKVMMI